MWCGELFTHLLETFKSHFNKKKRSKNSKSIERRVGRVVGIEVCRNDLRTYIGRGRRGVRERLLPEYGTSDAGMNVGL